MTERSSEAIERLIEDLLQASVDYERAEKLDAKYRRKNLEDAKTAIRTALQQASVKPDVAQAAPRNIADHMTRARRLVENHIEAYGMVPHPDKIKEAIAEQSQESFDLGFRAAGGSGPAVPQEVGTTDVSVPAAALDWLFGAGPDAEGKWFGECEEDATPRGMIRARPQFWWRSKFRSMIPALTRPQCK